MRKALLICLSLLLAWGMAYGQQHLAVTNQDKNENVATVEQHGWKQQAYQDQDGYRNVHEIYQYGSQNLATQTVGVGYAEDNWGRIEQHGSKQEAYQTQYWDNNAAEIVQYDFHNFAVQKQVGPPENGPASYAYAEQHGSRNIIVQDQETPGNPVTSGQNVALAYQNGWKNETYLTQYGYGNFADQAVNSGDKNLQVVTQTGDDNAAIQDVFWNGWKNEAYTTQTGDGNTAIVEQYGDQCTSIQTQTGDGNFVAHKQYN